MMPFWIYSSSLNATRSAPCWPRIAGLRPACRRAALLAPLLAMACSGTHVIDVEPTHHTIEVKPIYLTVDVNIRVQKELDEFFDDVEEKKEDGT
jgi:hypothetical protein